MSGNKRWEITVAANRLYTAFLSVLGTVFLLSACSPEPESLVAPVGDLGRAEAYWLEAGTVAWDVPEHSKVALYYSAEANLKVTPGGLDGGKSIALSRDGAVDGALAERFPHLSGLPVFRFAPGDEKAVPEILKSQFAVAASVEGTPVDATALQPAGVLDDLYAYTGELGVMFDESVPVFRLWAPTARSVKVLMFDDAQPDSQPSATLAMEPDPENGTWSIQGSADWNRKFYLYEIEVYVRRTGRIETNRVTDPYSLSLSTDSRRSQVVDLADADLAPEGWGQLAKPAYTAPEDIVLYELHVRDFSIADPTVPEPQRGTFAAFTHPDTNGMNHLGSLAEAGMSHVHLLPVFDCATIPEDPANRLSPPDLAVYDADSDRQQSEVDAVRAKDAFNWCYDPYHYTVPEGSYSTDPDGVTRIREFRAMVAALNRAGLRVVMDVVYNHTTSSGQADTSVLDRIVPDYYQRLDAAGEVETSTCCANTATENAMMEKLMVDSLLTWAVHYKVDAFRFDLMGHHSRDNIEKVRDALQALTVENDGVDGRSIYLYGEGWNFGEVADGARFVQAIQPRMGEGTGVGTFNDRIRDAVRGGAHDDEGIEHLETQGFVNGLYTAPNGENSGSEAEKARLLHFADLVRASLAGNLAEYRFTDRFGKEVAAREIDYNGQPAAYASDPQESINYVAAHDNETLFDINQYKLPGATTMADRVRVVNLANAIVALAQGVPFFHAGQEMLRSKSMDSNSFDSGDWFNLLDFSYADNGWARGLPPAWDNEANWPVAGPLLADPAMKPGPEAIQSAVAHFREMLQIRKSSGLFRLRTAQDISRRLGFHNTGPGQVPGLIVMALRGDEGEAVVVLFNATPEEQVFRHSGGGAFHLHPVQQTSRDMIVRSSKFNAVTGTFRVPARTVAVFEALVSR
jgi:pullulanase-type alpha-1,6-glucosidase